MMKKIQDSGEHQVYRGVRMRNAGKWVSEIREPRKKSRIWLGTYSNPEMAARAHDVASLSIKGKSAILNFPELADSLPRPVSLAPRDVQAAAAKAARMENFASTSSFVEMDLTTGVEDELSSLVQPPSLWSSYDYETTEFRDEFVYLESELVTWYSPPWSKAVIDNGTGSGSSGQNLYDN